MTFGTKWRPLFSGSRTAPKLNTSNEQNFFVHQFFEVLQLFLCLLVIKTFTLKLRCQAAFLRLQNLYLALCIRELVKRKRDTLAQNLRYRNVLKGISSDFDHSHKEDATR